MNNCTDNAISVRDFDETRFSACQRPTLIVATPRHPTRWLYCNYGDGRACAGTRASWRDVWDWVAWCCVECCCVMSSCLPFFWFLFVWFCMFNCITFAQAWVTLHKCIIILFKTNVKAKSQQSLLQHKPDERRKVDCIPWHFLADGPPRVLKVDAAHFLIPSIHSLPAGMSTTECIVID